ncbi:hypothetical protein E3P91_02476 [Wallemia ichthyophaga]|nr:hypothetical protein E3P91_02476 [Wallemia ichthyophaga]TIB62690.1 hypothetical protein E3P78_02233 [Wallemia ichthyophaga]
MSTPFKFVKPQVAFVNAPFSHGQPKRGTETGPVQLIKHGLAQQVETLGLSVDAIEDHSGFSVLENDTDIGKLKYPRTVSAATEKVYQEVKKHAQAGKLPVTLGGDHSLAMGTISGSLSAHPELCVVWVDAHADLNTPETTETGNLHGCPLSFLLGIAGDIPEFSWIKSQLHPSRLVYIGLRDVDDGEKRLLKEHNITAYSMHHVDKWGIGRVVEMALNDVNPDGTRPVHLSFDVDAMDPSVAPSTGTPVRGGLTFREGHYICEALHQTGLLVAVDLMEVNPTLADERAVKQTVSVGCSLVRSALGETLL